MFPSSSVFSACSKLVCLKTATSFWDKWRFKEVFDAPYNILYLRAAGTLIERCAALDRAIADFKQAFATEMSLVQYFEPPPPLQPTIQQPPPKEYAQTVYELSSYVRQQCTWDGGAFLRNALPPPS
jgi:hypothetical protein